MMRTTARPQLRQLQNSNDCSDAAAYTPPLVDKELSVGDARMAALSSCMFHGHRHETARLNSLSAPSFEYEILAKKDCQLQTCPRKRDHQPQLGCLPVGYSGRFACGAALRWFLERRLDWRSLGFT
jgi:hypothetical protein